MRMDYKVAEVELTYKTSRHTRVRTICTLDMADFIRGTYPDGKIEYQEMFKVFYLNARGEIIAYNTVSVGGINTTPVDFRIIMQGALLSNAVAMTVAHNHPSGDPLPSKFDDNITETLIKICELMNYRLFDHIILTKDDYYSYYENDRLKITHKRKSKKKQ